MADKSTIEIGAQFINRFHGTLSTSSAVDLATATLSPLERNKLKPEARISKIIGMLEKIEELAFEKGISEEERKARGERLDQIVSAFIEESIIKKEDVPNNHFQNQLRLLKERGYGELEINDDIKQQEIERIQNEQRASLRNWTDYLLSNDARSAYPTWFRFYVLKNISNLKLADKQRSTYPKRDKNYAGVFPELNQEVLSNLYDYVKEAAEIQFDEKAVAGLKKEEVDEKRRTLGNRKKELDNFGQLAYQGKFGQLYYNLGDRQREQQLTAIKERGMSGTEGEWKTFAQGSKTDELVKSLEGKGTGWCISGEETASKYLEQGDIHIYFTKDSDSKLSLPRVAVRMENGSVAEVRGVNSDQNLEPEFIDIAKEKYEKLPGGNVYDKKVFDMRMLTTIDAKIKNNDRITREELSFLYEINDYQIEGFGYKKDPRVRENREKRKKFLKQDYATIYDVRVDQVADKLDELNPDTIVSVIEDPVSIADISKINNGNLKILLGDVDGEITSVNIGGLKNIQVVKGMSLFKYGIYRIKTIMYGVGFQEDELLGIHALFKIQKARNQPNFEIGGWLRAIVNNSKNTMHSETDLKMLNELLHGYEDEAKYIKMSADDVTVKEIIKLVSDSKN